MALDYNYLMGLPPLATAQHLTSRDTMLYALGVGAGIAAAADPACLNFVYEKQLRALPTMATMLAYPGFWAQDPKYGISWRKLLHRDQSVEIHTEIPTEGSIRGEMTIDALYDRGSEKGALVCFSRRLFDAQTNVLLATVRQVNVLRADGGFGGPADATPPPQETPARKPDLRAMQATRPEQALIYRLCGDPNPLHVDPEIATAAGFDRPILHGLASFGVVGLAVVRALCGGEPRRLRRLDVRFSSPVYPGESFEILVWHLAVGKALVEARVVERDATVIRNGYLEYLPEE